MKADDTREPVFNAAESKGRVRGQTPLHVSWNLIP